MPQKSVRLGVLALRRPPVTRWGPGELRPSGLLMPVPQTAPNTLISTVEGIETWYLGARDMTLYSGDTGHHRDNLASGRAALWVAVRGEDPARAEVVCITADPYEGEGYAGDPALIVEAVPMPEGVGRYIAEFINAHHVEIPFKKRKRSPQDPNALHERAPRILQPEDKWGAGRRKK